MDIKVHVKRQDDLSTTFGDRETRKVYYKKDSTTNEMKTLRYIFHRFGEDYKNNVPLTYEFLNDQYEYWGDLYTRFIEYDIENLYESKTMTLFRCSTHSWYTKYLPIINELRKDGLYVYLSIIVVIEKDTKEDDLLIRFECFLVIDNVNYAKIGELCIDIEIFNMYTEKYKELLHFTSVLTKKRKRELKILSLQ
jgi:hypothetical protein